MKTVILAGGLGTRLSEETEIRPKPMVEIGGHPMLWHIMNIYSAAGFNEFVIALGYKGEVVKRYFLDFHALNSNLTVNLGSGKLTVHDGNRPSWGVNMVDTGADVMTGGRIKRLADKLRDGTFMLTYGDGLADLDIRKLVEFHRSHGKLCTVTAVHLPSRFGTFELTTGDKVEKFREKSRAGGDWINGGFFVCEPGVLDLIDGDETVWERDPLENLVEAGELMAYRHEGFWFAMDSLREKRELEKMWADGSAPWKVW
ncbi:MAG: glucose-1-phosphate cytidylyltransferase [bacterium]